MTRLTTRCIGLALVLLLLTSAVALAGTFEGPGRDDPKVGVSFEKERGLIKRFTMKRAKFFCTNGNRFRARMRAGDMSLDEQKRFQGRFTDSTGKVALRVAGSVTAGRAQGMTRIVAYVESYKCSTGPVDWQARATPG